MSWFDSARARFQLIFGRHGAESRMDSEIAFHIDMEAERLAREEGLPPDEARRRALVAFGGVVQHKEALRDGRGLGWVSGMSLDAKLALRMLAKHPGLTLVAVVGLSVAVAIGAVSFTGVYTLVDSRLPVSEGERVVGIRNIERRYGAEGRRTHLHDLGTWREALTTVAELGAYRTVARNLITGDGRAESVRIAEMTASGFRITRVPPLLGRYFNDDDERAGAAEVAVIGYDVWQTRFAGRSDIIGQPLQLGDVRHVVVGVMPSGYAFPVNNGVWTPLRLEPSGFELGHAPAIEVFGRLATGASVEDAQRQIATIGERLARAQPETHARMRTRLVPYTRTFIDNPEMPWIYHLVQLLVTMLLAVIGTNVAVLVYARTAGRMGEIAIRTALGASRTRVVWQLFAEALALSGTASVVGLAGAHLALVNIDAFFARIGGGQLPYWLRYHMTPGVVIYCAGLAVVGAVIVGVVPALKATREDVRANLQELSAGSTRIRLGGTWTLMIVTQVAVAVAFLPLAIGGINAWRRYESAESLLASKQIVTATLFVDRPNAGTQRLTTKRSVLGKVATLGAGAPDSDADDSAFAIRAIDLRSQLVRRLEGSSGVTDVALSSNPPAAEATVRVEMDTASPSSVSRNRGSSADASSSSVVGETRVDLRFFDAFDVPVLAGRTFGPADFSPSARTVIVNRSFVKKMLAGTSPLGRRLRAAPLERARRDTSSKAPWEEIVGVVADFPVDSSMTAPKVYRPLSLAEAGPVTIAVRFKDGSTTAFTNRLREMTVATNPMLRLDNIKSLDQTMLDESAGIRLTILVAELVTLSTVLLSAAGIYALMAFTITRRRREIGIRSALGAGPRRVLAGVLSRAFAQVTAGIVVGIAVAGVFDRSLEGGWTGRQASFVLPFVAALMMIVGVLAALGPARRALRIQPTEALRSE